MDWHTLLAPGRGRRRGVREARPGAHRPHARRSSPATARTYFNHIFGGGGGYSAGYYSYIWAEVLDADAFQAFKEKGIFDQATARAFRTNILERGASEDPMELYRRFRGREPRWSPCSPSAASSRPNPPAGADGPRGS